MGSKEVKLLGLWVSPSVRRVEWALKLKGVEYEYIEEDIYNKSPLLLELNPVHNKVPVLVHDGKVILDSLVILEYIDETWKDYPLLPQDPLEKAMARFWAKFGEEKLIVAAWIALCSHGEEKEKFVKLSIEALEKIEGELKLKENKFFGGENIGYLDLAMGRIPHWLPVWEEVGAMKIVDPLKFPATISWINNFLNHPVIKDCLPPRDKMVVYFQKRSKESEIMARVAAHITAFRKG
ncbi:glutathione S-transferase U7-like [Cornus florida]|uniref:glutathione S-transferase U7-like n=1 Tax=Cornus florida TaxID=4283 RepID=UPI0028A01F53|nr:glutathione S-transferase U7-like [Cornus florida]